MRLKLKLKISDRSTVERTWMKSGLVHWTSVVPHLSSLLQNTFIYQKNGLSYHREHRVIRENFGMMCDEKRHIKVNTGYFLVKDDLLLCGQSITRDRNHRWPLETPYDDSFLCSSNNKHCVELSSVMEPTDFRCNVMMSRFVYTRPDLLLYLQFNICCHLSSTGCLSILSWPTYRNISHISSSCTNTSFPFVTWHDANILMV